MKLLLLLLAVFLKHLRSHSLDTPVADFHVERRDTQIRLIENTKPWFHLLEIDGEERHELWFSVGGLCKSGAWSFANAADWGGGLCAAFRERRSSPWGQSFEDYHNTLRAAATSQVLSSGLLW